MGEPVKDTKPATVFGPENKPTDADTLGSERKPAAKEGGLDFAALDEAF